MWRAAWVVLGLSLASCANKPFVLEGGEVGVITVESCDGTTCTLRLSLVLDEVSGAPIGSLETDDFVVTELFFTEQGAVSPAAASRSTDVTDLDVESVDGPLYAAVLLDQSGSIRTLDPKNDRLDALGSLLSEGLSDGDLEEAALLSFPRHEALGDFAQTDLWQDFTDESGGLLDVLDGLADSEDGNTPLWDSLIETTAHLRLYRDLLGDHTARGVVVLVSDGADSSSDAEAEDALAALQDDRIPLMAAGIGDNIDFDGLQSVSAKSGGYFLTVDDAKELVDAIGSFRDAFAGDVTLTLVAELDAALAPGTQYDCYGNILFRESLEIDFNEEVYVAR